MTRQPTRFTKGDVSRAVKAMTGLGFKIGEVNIARDGSIKIVPLVEGAPKSDDDVLAKFRERHGYS